MHIIGVSVDIPTTPSLYFSWIVRPNRRLSVRSADTDRLKAIIKKHKPDYIFHMAAQPIVLSSLKTR